MQQVTKDQTLRESPHKTMLDDAFAQASTPIQHQLLQIEREALTLYQRVENTVSSYPAKQDIDSLRSCAIALSDELLELKQRAMQSSESLLKCAADADMSSIQSNPYAFRTYAISKLSTYPMSYIFGGTAVVLLMGDIHDILKNASSNAPETRDEQVTWVPPSSFERCTHKYWVESQNVIDVMLKCVTEVPVLVFGNEDTSLSTVNRDNKEDIWNSIATSITSVYFDSPKTMVMYKERIARIESAQLFRIRWYGDKPCGDELIFLELKTHHEQWVDNKSVKERVALRARDLTQALLRNGVKWTEDKAQELLLAAKPKLHGDDLDDAVDLLLRIRRLIIKKNLHPCVRSSYRRVAFQSNANNALRFTLDRDIELSNEADAPLGSWCRDDDTLVPSVMMPVTVFEVKLGGVLAPAWITSLLDRYKIQDGHKFSKYLSGASMLHEENVSCLPYWAEDPLFQGFYRNVRIESGMTSRAEDKPLIQTSHPSKGNYDRKDSDDTLLDSEKVSWLNNKDKKRSIFSTSKFRTSKKITPNQRVRVEPKTYFAAERTFIQWISAALLLVTMAVLLFSLSDQNGDEGPRVNGLILIFVATFVSIYALAIYFRRLYLMKRSKSYGYTDHFAPIILTIAVLAGIGSILYYSMGRDAYNGSGMYEVEGQCTTIPFTGISLLEFQPSDITIDRDRGVLIIASNKKVIAIKLDDDDVDKSVHVVGGVTNGDLEGAVLVDDLLFVVSEDSKLYAYKWEKKDWNGDNVGDMEMVGSWKLEKTVTSSEGIAFRPDENGGKGRLFISSTTMEMEAYNKEVSLVHVFDVPNIDGLWETTLYPLYHLNEKLMYDDNDGKIGAMQIFEDILYVMYDNARIIRGFDLTSGVIVSDIKLPRVGYSKGKFDKQWEGMYMERVANASSTSLSTESSIASSLRGAAASSNSSAGQDQIMMYLTLDSPPEIWTFAMNHVTGNDLSFPKCAVAE